VVLVTIGCAPANPGAQGAPQDERSAAGTKRATIAFGVGGIEFLYPPISQEPGGLALAGGEIVQELVNRGLSEADPWSVPQPVLAEAVPSIENGLWKILPDGRMETTWRIKPGVQWHDGAPYTSADLIFTLTAVLDPELTFRRQPAYTAIESAEAPDLQTIRVTWKRPAIDAHSLFNRELASPLPRHILEPALAEDKAGFSQLPYWSEKYVGTGPFKLQDVVPGSHLLLRANDSYVLGRPRIDELEIRTIPEPDTLLTTMLAGNADLMLDRRFDVDRAMIVESQWKEGRLETRFSGNWVVFPQLGPTSQPIALRDPAFRRALLEAIDRQQLSDLLFNGRSAVSHVYLGPDEVEYRDIEARIVRHDYDPRKAAQALEGLGYSRGGDGLYRDLANQRLALEIRADPGESKLLFTVADFWQKAGIAVEPTLMASQRLRDREYIATFPGLYLRGQSSRSSGVLRSLQSADIPRGDNRWVGGNYSQYDSPALDALIDRYFNSVPHQERTQALGGVVSHITSEVPVLYLNYQLQFTLVANRVSNVIPSKSAGAASKTWDSHLWDIRGT
jgi:peptide/nickel transport system substrate-binding protein